MALAGFQQECMCPDDNQRSALEHNLLHMYEREPDFHDLINKLVD